MHTPINERPASAILRHLREVLPTSAPLRLRWRAMSGVLGETRAILHKDGTIKSFVMTLNTSLRARTEFARITMVDTLIHEMAHALAPTWVADHPNFDQHGAEWGLMFARVYQQVMETD